jgi:hypothetical protein
VFVLHELIQIRVGVASAIFLYSLSYLYKKNISAYLICILISTLFHYSAFLLIFLLFLNTKKINVFLYTSIIFCSYALYSFNIHISTILEHLPFEIVRQKIIDYKMWMNLGQFTKLNVFNVVQMSRVFISLLGMYSISLLQQKNQYSILLLKVYVYSIVLFVLFSDFPVFAVRLSELMGCVEILFIPLFIYCFKQELLAKLFIVFYSLLIFTINVFYNKLILLN